MAINRGEYATAFTAGGIIVFIYILGFKWRWIHAILAGVGTVILAIFPYHIVEDSKHEH